MSRRGAGSNTNASDAIDDVVLPSDPTLDELLDEAVKETFPASDPVSPAARGETEWERQRRG